MIFFSINTKDYENDVRVMTQAFYPDTKITTENCDNPELSIAVFVDDRKVKGSVTGADITGASFEYDVYEDKKRTRNRLKRELYGIYSSLTGRSLPWGTLTGIRPVKIPLAMVEEGVDDKTIIRHLEEEYLVNEKKSLLSLEVATNENELLKTLDYKNGYSLYIGIPFCPTTCLYCSLKSASR